MFSKESAGYPIDSAQVTHYFCIQKYKRREKNKICFFVLVTIQKIKKVRGRYFKRFIKKKESDILKKRSKVLGFLVGLAAWSIRRDGSFYRVSRNYILLLRGGKLKEATLKSGIGGLRVQANRLRGATSRDVMRSHVVKKFPFLLDFRWRYY